MDKRKLAQLGDRAQKLGELKEHPSWAVLKQIVEAKKKKQYDYFTGLLMKGDEIDQRKLDFLRGFWAGAEYLIANPDHAEATFEQAMKQAKAFDESEDE